MRSLQFPVCLAVLVSCCFLVDQAQAEPRPVTRVTIHAPSVARDMAFNLILPAGYENSGKRYPVLYLLHGRNQDLEIWPRMRVPEYAANYDLIVMMPDAGNSWYVNWAESEGGEKNDWTDYIIEDLIGYVDAHYRTITARAGRAIDGYSMGGYGTLYLGFTHPELSFLFHQQPLGRPALSRALATAAGSGSGGACGRRPVLDRGIHDCEYAPPSNRAGIRRLFEGNRAQGPHLCERRPARRARPLQARAGRAKRTAPRHPH